MPFIPIPDVVKAALIYRAAGNQEVVNTLYFRKDAGSVGFADLAVVSAGLATWFGNTIQTILSADVELDRIELKDLSVVDSFVRVDSYNLNGDSVGNIEPLSVTKRVNFGTGFGGRSFRGSNYWPALRTADVNGNLILSGALTNIENAYANLLPGGAYPIADFTWVVVSRVQDGVDRLPGISTPVIQVYTSGTDVDVMRSRVDP